MLYFSATYSRFGFYCRAQFNALVIFFASMAFVVRASVAARPNGLPSWCTTMTSIDGVIELVLKVIGVQTVVAASVSEFGDLGSYAMLSQSCRAMQSQLAASMTVVRNHASAYFIMSPSPSGACSNCSGYGDDLCGVDSLGRRRCFPCDGCEELVCEHCVCLASFGRDGVEPTSWVCTRLHDDEVPVCTVESVRSWLFELADARMLVVYKDYDFDFWLQFITLSGEVVRDRRNRPCPVLISSWHSSFDQVWWAVYQCTRGRIRQMVFADVFVDDFNNAGFRWSHFLTRPVARAFSKESPLQVTVLLRDWS